MKSAHDFAAWDTETLATFAAEVMQQNLQLQDALEQARTDLRDAMKLARANNNKDDWK